MKTVTKVIDSKYNTGEKYKDIRFFVECQDGCGGVIIETIEEDGKLFGPEIYISLWNRDYMGYRISFFQKIKVFWEILRNRGPWADSVTIGAGQAKALIEHLSDMVNRIEEDQKKRFFKSRHYPSPNMDGGI